MPIKYVSNLMHLVILIFKNNYDEQKGNYNKNKVVNTSKIQCYMFIFIASFVGLLF